MGGHLRVLTANLWNGGADPTAFGELVRSRDVDVVAVQELGPDQADALGEVLPHGHLEPSQDYRGMGIALRRPAALSRLPLDYRDGRIARLDPADWPGLGRPVEILNTHIISPLVPPILTMPAVRRRQVQGILDHIAADPEHARAVVGDFNATPIWPVYRRMARALDDVAAAHARTRNTRPRRTWPRGLGRLRLLRIDHCFTRGLTARSVEVVDLPGSDHCGVLLDLELTGVDPDATADV